MKNCNYLTKRINDFYIRYVYIPAYNVWTGFISQSGPDNRIGTRSTSSKFQETSLNSEILLQNVQNMLKKYA